MQKVVFAAFVAFWTFVATLLAVNSLSPEHQPRTAEETERSIPLAEVNRHDAPDDCWAAIEGKVYDLTDYVPEHPAPDFVLTSWCGKEATQGMRNKGYGREHSAAAWAKLEQYQIGVLIQ